MGKYFCTCDAAKKVEEVYCGTRVGHEKQLNGTYMHREHDTDREVQTTMPSEAKKRKSSFVALPIYVVDNSLPFPVTLSVHGWSVNVTQASQALLYQPSLSNCPQLKYSYY